MNLPQIRSIRGDRVRTALGKGKERIGLHTANTLQYQHVRVVPTCVAVASDRAEYAIISNGLDGWESGNKSGFYERKKIDLI